MALYLYRGERRPAVLRLDAHKQLGIRYAAKIAGVIPGIPDTSCKSTPLLEAILQERSKSVLALRQFTLQPAQYTTTCLTVSALQHQRPLKIVLSTGTATTAGIEDHEENQECVPLSCTHQSEGSQHLCFLPVGIEGAQRHGRESQPVRVQVEVEVDRVAEVLPVEDPELPVH